MNKVIKMAAVAATLSAFGTMASAVTTVNAGFPPVLDVGGIVAAPNGSAQFDYVAAEDLMISSFSFSAVGNSGGADIDKIMVSFIPDEKSAPVMLTAVGELGGQTFGGGLANGFSVAEGETWSILFSVEDGQSLASDVGVQLAFSAEELAPIPLPAAGGLLLAALAAGGVVGRRKKKAD